ncbi:MAG TPA: tartrate-resistant acid phosphatase type 5 family protein [Steroidobacteraceae bacterium]|nr:tartrate-resistant acid phosphatase type 5 family protein [Steroidobacteraceae bacterium]
MLNRREVLSGFAASAAATMLPKLVGASPAETLEFLVVGDWGRDGSSHQREVAAQMGRTARSRGSRHIISVGDNFYEDGVQSASDPQWRTSYEEIYSAASLQIPWYVALGNHDYRGVPQAQIDYSKTSTRWRMPSRYYKVAGSDIGAPHLDLFVLDTSPLVHKYRDKVHSAIAENVAGQDVPAQLAWLDEQLGQSTASWKLVIGHHTVHSGGTGHGDTPETTTLIEPLLQKHGVQAYINGHDHDMQHIRRGGVDYICCGAGSEVRPVQAIEGTLFCAARSGFAAISSDPHALSLEFRDYTGARLYHGKIPRGAAAAAEAA